MIRKLKRRAAGRGGRGVGGARRRGTVILFAVAVLAIVSLSALSYVTIVRLDRQSSDAVARVVNYDQQVDAVLDRIRALVAADLFGNKIVTTDVPAQSFDGLTRLWPRMYEDADVVDYPRTEFSSFVAGENANRLPLLNPVVPGGVRRFAMGPADDAWLAPLEPYWVGNSRTNPGASWWRQLTNLRSGYIYDDNGTDNNFADDFWRREDGLYVDLGQFFLDELNRGGPRGNGGTDLSDPALSAISPRFGAGLSGSRPLAPFYPVHLVEQPFGYAGDDPERLTGRDDRFFADTDGDLRADARWQQLDALGNLYGLVWVTAARIVDASALVNVNSAIGNLTDSRSPGNNNNDGFQPSVADELAVGFTPADVDLARLIAHAERDEADYSPSQLRDRWDFTQQDANGNRRLDIAERSAWDLHLTDNLGAREVLIEAGQTPSLTQEDWWWRVTGRPKREWRRAVWENFGSSPREATVGLGYPVQTMVDLHAFRGTNNRAFLSPLEEALDGPADSGLSRLPGDGRLGYGPLRSTLGSTEERRAGNTVQDTLPTDETLRWTTRGLLTTVSGASFVGPMPVLNTDATEPWREGESVNSGTVSGGTGTGPALAYGGVTSIPKIGLSDFGERDVPRAYEAFAWALAPLVGDDPISYEHLWARGNPNNPLIGEDLGPATTFHYGGGADGPAEKLLGFDNQPFFAGGQLPGATYALATAGALALNLADATDSNNDPSVARLLAPDDGAAIESVNFGGQFVFGTRFPFGDIVSDAELTSIRSVDDLLPITAAGRRLGGGGSTTGPIDGDEWGEALAEGRSSEIDAALAEETGLTLIGFERHPYITEVFTAASYQTLDDNTFDYAAPKDKHGSLIAVELSNPWPGDIIVDQSTEIWLLDPTVATGFSSQSPLMLDDAHAGHLRLRINGAETIQAGTSTVFVFAWELRAGGQLALLGENDDPADPTSARDTEEWMVEAVLDSPEPATVSEVPLVVVEPRSSPSTPADPLDAADLDGAPVIWDDPAGFELVSSTGPRPAVMLVRRVAPPGSSAVEPAGDQIIMPLDTVWVDAGQQFPVRGRDDASANIPADAQALGATLGLGDPGVADAYFLNLGYVTDPLLNLNWVAERDNAANWRGRVMFTQSLTRPTSRPPSGGMPAYVFDTAGPNPAADAPWSAVVEPDYTAADKDGVYATFWLQTKAPNNNPQAVGAEWDGSSTTEGFISTTDGAGMSPAYALVRPADVVGGGFPVDEIRDDDLLEDAWTDEPHASGAKPADQVTAIDPWGVSAGSALGVGWQLHIFNEPLQSPADLQLLTKFAHVVRDNKWTIFAEWLPVSRQLRQSLNYDYTLGGAANNPYAGVLDPSRFAPTGSAAGVELPTTDRLAVPLATRVFDLFDATTPLDRDLVEGRVNVNTAPPRVLEALPMVAPAANGGASFLGIGGSPSYDRVSRLLGYRDAYDAEQSTPRTEDDEWKPAGFDVTGSYQFGISGGNRALRRGEFTQGGQPALNYSRAGFESPLGFANTGELTLLNNWIGGAGDIGLFGFQSFEGRSEAILDWYDNGANDLGTTDDVEERMAVFRAVANIVTTRSDVFLAWFVVRGYDPDVIESIELEDTSFGAAMDAMDDERFAPTYESRWLAVLDRSNVRQPTDRPEVVLLIEAPPASR